MNSSVGKVWDKIESKLLCPGFVNFVNAKNVGEFENIVLKYAERTLNMKQINKSENVRKLHKESTC